MTETIEQNSNEVRMTLIDNNTRIRIEKYENDKLVETTLSTNQEQINQLKEALHL